MITDSNDILRFAIANPQPTGPLNRQTMANNDDACSAADHCRLMLLRPQQSSKTCQHHCQQQRSVCRHHATSPPEYPNPVAPATSAASTAACNNGTTMPTTGKHLHYHLPTAPQRWAGTQWLGEAIINQERTLPVA